MIIEDIPFNTFKKNTKGEEGIVALGCGGDANEWVEGITNLLNEEEIAKGSADNLWKNIYKLTTTGGRTDIVFVSHNCLKDFNVSKMAMWRLRMGDISWISDYVTNYAKHF